MNGEAHIPENLARNAARMRGEAGEAWISNLPDLVGECEKRWSIEVGEALPNLSINWVARARRADGPPAVLKLSFPGDREFETGAEALRLFDGRGAARLLELDLPNGAMLLERVEPGAPLAGLEDDDERATRVVARVMKSLQRPAPPGHPFPTVFERTRALARLRERFGGGTGPLPAGLVGEAEHLFEALISSQEPPVLLHGDLHHDNVLSSDRESWLAIDPKGVVGEPAFDVGAMLHNPAGLLETSRPRETLERRVRVLSEELGVEAERVRGWGVSQAVLSACWSLEDHGKVWEEALEFARLLSGEGVG